MSNNPDHMNVYRPQRSITRTYSAGPGAFVEPDYQVIPSSLMAIAPILQVSNDIENERPRVAYILLFYALNKAHSMDPRSVGRGVRQFKSALLHKLERDDDFTLRQRTGDTAKKELQEYYDEFHAKNADLLRGNHGAHANRAHLAKIYQKSAILLEVLKYISPQIEIDGKDVEDQPNVLVAYNILPLDSAGASETIRTFPQIKAVIAALQDVRGLLPVESGSTKLIGKEYDLFDWLGSTFGFQEDNVKNQKEHFILLLANTHARQVPRPDPFDKLSDTALSEVMEKLFENYRRWCRFLSCSDNLRYPSIQRDILQHRILYVGLYLLIWGEAANLRFMPECLCYIFHQMARDLNKMLDGEISILTYRENPEDWGENSEDQGEKPDHREIFLKNFVMPIYDLIAEEFNDIDAKNGHHSAWRNYDDFNEYFWSVECFSLGWPMKLEAGFFRRKPRENIKQINMNQSSVGIGKANFVETRSFWHIFRSFDRMWSFLIMSLQVIIIIAWNDIGFTGSVLSKVSSIFITYAFLTWIHAVVHVGLSIKGWRSMKGTDITWYALKVLVSSSWAIALPILYADGTEDSNMMFASSPYVIAVLVFLFPDIVSAFFFLFPTFRQAIEQSQHTVVQVLLWWEQPRMYVGRSMYESPYNLFKYTLFWVFLFTCKLLFSFYVEIRPLVKPTKDIMAATAAAGPLANEKQNFGVVILLWAPILMVFFMDIQIWYTIWATIFGGIGGIFLRIGEVRTLEILESKFPSLPGAFNVNLVSLACDHNGHYQFLSPQKSNKPLDDLCTSLPNTEQEISIDENPRSHYGKNDTRITKEMQLAMFSHIWNAIIKNLWHEDYIKNSEVELLIMPYSCQQKFLIRWPAFLLGNKVALAVDTVENYCKRSNVNDDEVFHIFNQDPYMEDAVKECYELLQNVLRSLVIGNHGKRIIEHLIFDIEEHIKEGTFLKTFGVTGLVSILFHKIVDFVRILEKPDANKAGELTFLLQDLFEVYLNASLKKGDRNWPEEMHKFEFQQDSILYPHSEDVIKEKIKRLRLLLTMEEVSMDFPFNIEARRRIRFFVNSLFMDMPSPPPIQNMLSFSILTPYNGESILFTQSDLTKENEDGISPLYYLKTVYSDEWENLLKRIEIKESDLEKLMQTSDKIVNEVCRWASFRAQTLTRTVRGMMYYRKALEMHAFFETAQGKDILEGFGSVLESDSDDVGVEKLHEKIQALIDLKFTYVVSCQEDEFHKHAGESHANDVVNMLNEFPSLRVAYVEVQESKKKEYYSVLVKGIKESNSFQTVYKIKLPGQPIVGEGKAENQNHAIIFTRGDALQAVDMNQDSYLEEALKMRNFLQELTVNNGTRTPSLLGMSKHIFSGSVSSLAGFMSRLESTSASLEQRVLVNSLKVSFHYGHPDVFDRLFHLSRGGISKASPIINLSEHIFAGFNTILRRGFITHHEYLKVGKGRNMGLTQISLAEARNSTGIGEQTISRDIYRLGRHLDFFRMCSVYCSTVGPCVNSLIAMLVIYVFLYGRIYLSLNGFESNGELRSATLQGSQPLQFAMLSEVLMMIGFLFFLPMMMEMGLEKGFRKAVSEFFVMQFQLACVYFTLLMGTKLHFYGRTLLHGGVKYKGKFVQSKHSSVHSFVIFHIKFSENYQLYSRSHFTKGFELLLLLIVYHAYGVSVDTWVPSLIIGFLWFLVATWLLAPFLFNPYGFDWQKMVEDFDDFMKWINNRGGIGVPAESSWETWWEDEQKHLKFTGVLGRIIESLLAIRFFVYQYGLVHHLHVAKGVGAYLISWTIVLCVFILPEVTSRKVKNNQLLVRVKDLLITVASLVALGLLAGLTRLTLVDLLIIVIAVLPSGWGIIQIVQSWKWALPSNLKNDHIRGIVKSTARRYDIIMGCILFLPLAILSWIPFTSDFQNRVLFNEALSRGLHISRILARRKDKKS